MLKLTCMKKLFLPLLLFISFSISAQNKKPLNHSVYDGWKSLGEERGRGLKYQVLGKDNWIYNQKRKLALSYLDL